MTNALLNQHAMLHAEISQLLGPNASQTVVSLPRPLEAFKVKPSDLRITFFWTMSLCFSLFAAITDPRLSTTGFPLAPQFFGALTNAQIVFRRII